MKRHLVIMAKAPRIGRVKTRLGRDIGHVRAWCFYRRMLSSVLRPLARDRRWTAWLAVAPDSALRKGRLWPVRAPRLAQGDGDLGERMDRVMAVMAVGPVVIIGADIPGIRPGHIDRAFRALGGHDAVFGPAADGGYWLVGLRRRPARTGIFGGVRWSSAHALADTRANLPAHWRVRELEVLADVDDGRSYAALRRGRARPAPELEILAESGRT